MSGAGGFRAFAPWGHNRQAPDTSSSSTRGNHHDSRFASPRSRGSPVSRPVHHGNFNRTVPRFQGRGVDNAWQVNNGWQVNSNAGNNWSDNNSFNNWTDNNSGNNWSNNNNMGVNNWTPRGMGPQTYPWQGGYTPHYNAPPPQQFFPGRPPGGNAFPVYGYPVPMVNNYLQPPPPPPPLPPPPPPIGEFSSSIDKESKNSKLHSSQNLQRMQKLDPPKPIPHLGSEEERVQKITEAADKLKRTLSIISKKKNTRETKNEDDARILEIFDQESENEPRIANKGIPELKHDPPELSLTVSDLRDIGRIDHDHTKLIDIPFWEPNSENCRKDEGSTSEKSELLQGQPEVVPAGEGAQVIDKSVFQAQKEKIFPQSFREENKISKDKIFADETLNTVEKTSTEQSNSRANGVNEISEKSTTSEECPTILSEDKDNDLTSKFKDKDSIQIPESNIVENRNEISLETGTPPVILEKRKEKQENTSTERKQNSTSSLESVSTNVKNSVTNEKKFSRDNTPTGEEKTHTIEKESNVRETKNQVQKIKVSTELISKTLEKTDDKKLEDKIVSENCQESRNVVRKKGQENPKLSSIRGYNTNRVTPNVVKIQETTHNLPPGFDPRLTPEERARLMPSLQDFPMPASIQGYPTSTMPVMSNVAAMNYVVPQTVPNAIMPGNNISQMCMGDPYVPLLPMPNVPVMGHQMVLPNDMMIQPPLPSGPPPPPPPPAKSTISMEPELEDMQEAMEFAKRLMDESTSQACQDINESEIFHMPTFPDLPPVDLLPPLPPEEPIDETFINKKAPKDSEPREKVEDTSGITQVVKTEDKRDSLKTNRDSLTVSNKKTSKDQELRERVEESIRTAQVEKADDKRDSLKTNRDSLKSKETKTPESTWKNRVIGRFLKMSQNDIRNMINNASLRKFDIAMKHLVNERRSSFSLEMRTNEEERMKDAGYNREEFMDQLSAMLDPSATVEIADLPNQFIHHLSEVLQLDVMPELSSPLEEAQREPPEIGEPSKSVEAVDQERQNSQKRHRSKEKDSRTETVKPETFPTKSSHERPRISRSYETTGESKAKTSNEQINRGVPSTRQRDTGTDLQIATKNGNSMENDETSNNFADFDVFLAGVDRTKNKVGDVPLRETRERQRSFERTAVYITDEVPDRARTKVATRKSSMETRIEPRRDEDAENTERRSRWSIHRSALLDNRNSRRRSSSRPSSMSDKRLFLRSDLNRENEREELFRNPTREEWEARYGETSREPDTRSPSATRRDLVAPDSGETTGVKSRLGEIVDNAHETLNIDEFAHGRDTNEVHRNNCNFRNKDLMSTSTSDSCEDDHPRTEVTKLLKVIKEREKIAKKKSLSEEMRDEVAAEIERERRERDSTRKHRRSGHHHHKKDKRARSQDNTRPLHTCRIHRKHRGDEHFIGNNECNTYELEQGSSKSRVQNLQRTFNEYEIKSDIVIKEEPGSEISSERDGSGKTPTPVRLASDSHSALNASSSLFGAVVPASTTQQPKTKAQLKQMPMELVQKLLTLQKIDKQQSQELLPVHDEIVVNNFKMVFPTAEPSTASFPVHENVRTNDDVPKKSNTKKLDIRAYKERAVVDETPELTFPVHVNVRTIDDAPKKLNTKKLDARAYKERAVVDGTPELTYPVQENAPTNDDVPKKSNTKRLDSRAYKERAVVDETSDLTYPVQENAPLNDDVPKKWNTNKLDTRAYKERAVVDGTPESTYPVQENVPLNDDVPKKSNTKKLDTRAYKERVVVDGASESTFPALETAPTNDNVPKKSSTNKLDTKAYKERAVVDGTPESTYPVHENVRTNDDVPKKSNAKKLDIKAYKERARQRQQKQNQKLQPSTETSVIQNVSTGPVLKPEQESTSNRTEERLYDSQSNERERQTEKRGNIISEKLNKKLESGNNEEKNDQRGVEDFTVRTEDRIISNESTLTYRRVKNRARRAESISHLSTIGDVSRNIGRFAHIKSEGGKELKLREKLKKGRLRSSLESLDLNEPPHRPKLKRHKSLSSVITETTPPVMEIAINQVPFTIMDTWKNLDDKPVASLEDLESSEIADCKSSKEITKDIDGPIESSNIIESTGSELISIKSEAIDRMLDFDNNNSRAENARTISSEPPNECLIGFADSQKAETTDDAVNNLMMTNTAETLESTNGMETLEMEPLENQEKPTISIDIKELNNEENFDEPQVYSFEEIPSDCKNIDELEKSNIKIAEEAEEQTGTNTLVNSENEKLLSEHCSDVTSSKKESLESLPTKREIKEEEDRIIKMESISLEEEEMSGWSPEAAITSNVPEPVDYSSDNSFFRGFPEEKILRRDRMLTEAELTKDTELEDFENAQLVSEPGNTSTMELDDLRDTNTPPISYPEEEFTDSRDDIETSLPDLLGQSIFSSEIADVSDPINLQNIPIEITEKIDQVSPSVISESLENASSVNDLSSSVKPPENMTLIVGEQHSVDGNAKSDEVEQETVEVAIGLKQDAVIETVSVSHILESENATSQDHITQISECSASMIMTQEILPVTSEVPALENFDPDVLKTGKADESSSEAFKETSECLESEKRKICTEEISEIVKKYNNQSENNSECSDKEKNQWEKDSKSVDKERDSENNSESVDKEKNQSKKDSESTDKERNPSKNNSEGTEKERHHSKNNTENTNREKNQSEKSSEIREKSRLEKDSESADKEKNPSSRKEDKKSKDGDKIQEKSEADSGSKDSRHSKTKVHKAKKKSSHHHNHGSKDKKTPLTEKMVEEAIAADIVKVVPKKTSRESVMARMMEIDVEIHKLMNEKMTLYKMLESGDFTRHEDPDSTSKTIPESTKNPNEIKEVLGATTKVPEKPTVKLDEKKVEMEKTKKRKKSPHRDKKNESIFHPINSKEEEPEVRDDRKSVERKIAPAAKISSSLELRAESKEREDIEKRRHASKSSSRENKLITVIAKDVIYSDESLDSLGQNEIAKSNEKKNKEAKEGSSGASKGLALLEESLKRRESQHKKHKTLEKKKAKKEELVSRTTLTPTEAQAGLINLLNRKKSRKNETSKSGGKSTASASEGKLWKHVSNVIDAVAENRVTENKEANKHSKKTEPSKDHNDSSKFSEKEEMIVERDTEKRDSRFAKESKSNQDKQSKNRASSEDTVIEVKTSRERSLDKDKREESTFVSEPRVDRDVDNLVDSSGKSRSVSLERSENMRQNSVEKSNARRSISRNKYAAEDVESDEEEFRSRSRNSRRARQQGKSPSVGRSKKSNERESEDRQQFRSENVQGEEKSENKSRRARSATGRGRRERAGPPRKIGESTKGSRNRKRERSRSSGLSHDDYEPPTKKSQSSQLDEQSRKRSKKRKRPEMSHEEMASCKVELIDCKYTYLSPTMQSKILKKFGISRINPYVPSIPRQETTSFSAWETPFVSRPKTPTISEQETTSISRQETPLISREKSPSVSGQETPLISREKSPSISGQETPLISREKSPSISEQETPLISRQETPSRPSTPSISRQGTPSPPVLSKATDKYLTNETFDAFDKIDISEEFAKTPPRIIDDDDDDVEEEEEEENADEEPPSTCLFIKENPEDDGFDDEDENIQVFKVVEENSQGFEQSREDEEVELIGESAVNLDEEENAEKITTEDDGDGQVEYQVIDEVTDENEDSEDLSNEAEIINDPTSPATESRRNEEDEGDEPRRTRYTVHKGPILDIKVLDDSFLAASEDGAIYRYSQTSNGILNIYKGHEAAVTCIYVYEMPDKRWNLYSGSLDGTFRCYDITSGAQGRPFNVGSPVQCMDQGWGTIFIGTKSGHISRYNIKSAGIKEESLEFSDKSVLALKVSAEGPRRVLIVASRNQPITIRDANTGLFLRTICGYKTHTVYSLMRDRNLVYCGTSSTSIPVYDFTNGEQVTQYHAGVGIVCMRLYRQVLFAGCYDGNIYVFDTKEAKLLCSIPGPGNMLLSMEIVDDEIIAGSKNRQLHSWRMPKEVRSLLLERT